MSPEHVPLWKATFETMMKKHVLGNAIFDEGHCISIWLCVHSHHSFYVSSFRGRRFRSAYEFLCFFKSHEAIKNLNILVSCYCLTLSDCCIFSFWRGPLPQRLFRICFESWVFHLGIDYWKAISTIRTIFSTLLPSSLSRYALMFLSIVLVLRLSPPRYPAMFLISEWSIACNLQRIKLKYLCFQ